jgi:hypothetical protein
MFGKRKRNTRPECYPRTGMMRYQLQEGMWPASPVNGDEVEFVDTGGTYIFANGRWTVMSCQYKSDVELVSPSKKTGYLIQSHPTNCKNCGAVLSSSVCEYCGTTYTDH